MFGIYRNAFRCCIALTVIEFAIAVPVGKLMLDMSNHQIFRLSDLRPVLPTLLIFPLAWLAFMTVLIVVRRKERPLALLTRMVVRNRKWLLSGIVLFALCLPYSRSFSIFKSAIDLINPYYLDPQLIALDRIIFFGRDGWQLTHAIGWDGFTLFIDRVYFLWFTYVALISGWFSFARDPRFQLQAWLALNLTWILVGVAMAIALSSVGPIFVADFYGIRDFDPLTANLASLNERYGLVAFIAMEFLRENAGSGRFGSGISAMPSMHVATSFLGVVAMYARPVPRWIRYLAVAFTVLILVGSVHLGWHYLTDGLVSMAMVLAVWRASGWFVDRSARPPNQIKDIL